MTREQFEASQAYRSETERYIATDGESIAIRVRKFRAQSHHIRKRAHKLARRMRRLSARIDSCPAALNPTPERTNDEQG